MMLAAFAHPVFDSQRNFRELLQAMARPIAPRAMPVLAPAPAPILPASMAALLTLCDADTTLWLQQPNDAVAMHLRFHAGVRLVQDPADADFALITEPASMPPLTMFAHGDLRYPDRSATLIMQVDGFRGNAGKHFAGPGIRDVEQLLIEGLPGEFWQQRAAMSAQLPLGVDLIFISGQRMVALPRTTRVLED
jgi:alpha-D-ribose 1-methylphosphonate 5-triphosphate synthase subunit PhnH